MGSQACIITYDEYIDIPYVKCYEELLNKNDITYDIVLWNRSGNVQENDSNAVKQFLFQHRTHKSKTSKIIPFLLWRNFIKSVLRNNEYDLLIICTTVPAVLLYEILIKDFKRNYLLDIRDFTYENIFIYRYMLKRLILAAGMTVISSKGFNDWLPCDNGSYTVTHNITNEYAG